MKLHIDGNNNYDCIVCARQTENERECYARVLDHQKAEMESGLLKALSRHDLTQSPPTFKELFITPTLPTSSSVAADVLVIVKETETRELDALAMFAGMLNLYDTPHTIFKRLVCSNNNNNTRSIMSSNVENVDAMLRIAEQHVASTRLPLALHYTHILYKIHSSLLACLHICTEKDATLNSLNTCVRDIHHALNDAEEAFRQYISPPTFSEMMQTEAGVDVSSDKQYQELLLGTSQQEDSPHGAEHANEEMEDNLSVDPRIAWHQTMELIDHFLAENASCMQLLSNMDVHPRSIHTSDISLSLDALLSWTVRFHQMDVAFSKLTTTTTEA